MLLITKSALREARKCHVGESSLLNAWRRARSGGIDAQLSATLIKHEVSRPPEGRKTACRALFACKKQGRFAVVLHVYAKSAKANLTPRESEAFDDLSRQVVSLSNDQTDKLIRTRGWKEIDDSQD